MTGGIAAAATGPSPSGVLVRGTVNPYPPIPAAPIGSFVEPGVGPAAQFQSDPTRVEQAQTNPVVVDQTPANQAAPAVLANPGNAGNVGNPIWFPQGGFGQFMPNMWPGMGMGPGTGGNTNPQGTTSQTTPIIAPVAQDGVAPVGPAQGQPGVTEAGPIQAGLADAQAAGPWDDTFADEEAEPDEYEESEGEEGAPEEFAEEEAAGPEDMPMDGPMGAPMGAMPPQAGGPVGGMAPAGAGRLPFTGAPMGIAAAGLGLLTAAVGCMLVSVRRRRSSGAQ
ncbi:hypothetical protein ACQP1K_10115 [Sphaerimonospora sp. CA-214678]|uniref:hypothetical protein n=1 Tax=Sphaerimonospora sp. CA-214678 TaxID=3240029 RepID=UPI003D8FE6DD